MAFNNTKNNGQVSQQQDMDNFYFELLQEMPMTQLGYEKTQFQTVYNPIMAHTQFAGHPQYPPMMPLPQVIPQGIFQGQNNVIFNPQYLAPQDHLQQQFQYNAAHQEAQFVPQLNPAPLNGQFYGQNNINLGFQHLCFLSEQDHFMQNGHQNNEHVQNLPLYAALVDVQQIQRQQRRRNAASRNEEQVRLQRNSAVPAPETPAQAPNKPQLGSKNSPIEITNDDFHLNIQQPSRRDSFLGPPRKGAISTNLVEPSSAPPRATVTAQVKERTRFLKKHLSLHGFAKEFTLLNSFANLSVTMRNKYSTAFWPTNEAAIADLKDSATLSPSFQEVYFFRMSRVAEQGVPEADLPSSSSRSSSKVEVELRATSKRKFEKLQMLSDLAGALDAARKKKCGRNGKRDERVEAVLVRFREEDKEEREWEEHVKANKVKRAKKNAPVAAVSAVEEGTPADEEVMPNVQMGQSEPPPDLAANAFSDDGEEGVENGNKPEDDSRRDLEIIIPNAPADDFFNDGEAGDDDKDEDTSGAESVPSREAIVEEDAGMTVADFFSDSEDETDEVSSSSAQTLVEKQMPAFFRKAEFDSRDSSTEESEEER